MPMRKKFSFSLEKSTEQQQVIIDGDGITIYAKGENPHPAAKLTLRLMLENGKGLKY